MFRKIRKNQDNTTLDQCVDRRSLNNMNEASVQSRLTLLAPCLLLLGLLLPRIEASTTGLNKTYSNNDGVSAKSDAQELVWTEWATGITRLGQ